MPLLNTSMQGKVCLITGAHSGIGKATALGLARMGATVVMVCRDRTSGEEAQREINAYVSFPSPFSLSQKEALIAHLLLSRCVSRRLRGKDREKNQRSQPREMRKRSV